MLKNSGRKKMGNRTDYRIDKEHTHGICTHEHRIGSRNNKNNNNNPFIRSL